MTELRIDKSQHFVHILLQKLYVSRLHFILSRFLKPREFLPMRLKQPKLSILSFPSRTGVSRFQHDVKMYPVDKFEMKHTLLNNSIEVRSVAH